MNKKMNKEIYSRVENEIAKLKEKSFNIFFYVPDAKNNLTGYISYIYNLAGCLKSIGYNVKMLYSIENEYSDEELKELTDKDMPIDENRIFVGIKDCKWCVSDEEIEHVNINKIDVEISPSDFLIIPEVFYQVMNQTIKLNCKRIVLMQNYNHLLEFLPLGTSLGHFSIRDVLTITKNEESLVKSVFPYVNTKIIHPYIPSYFYNDKDEPKDMVINIVCKNQSYVNKIVKPFYWKYPMLKWVSFRDLRGFNRMDFSDALRDGAITIWVDDDCSFGYMGIEAIKSGSILIGKIPSNHIEWMTNDDGTFMDNGIWFNDINDVHKIIADVVFSWITDEIPEELINAMNETSKKYTYSTFVEEVKKVFNEYTEERIKEFEEVKIIAKNSKYE